MDTALPEKFPFILDRNLAKANCAENHVLHVLWYSSPWFLIFWSVSETWKQHFNSVIIEVYEKQVKLNNK